MQNLLATLLLLPLLGCSSQLPIRPDPSSDSPEGISYMLPRGKIRIVLFKQQEGGQRSLQERQRERQQEGQQEGQQEKGKKFILMFAGTTFVPDKGFDYYVTHDRSSLASDKLVVDVTSDGLLDAIKLTTEDVTDQVIVKIVELAGRVAGGAVGFTPFGRTDDVSKAGYDLLYDAEFDPFSLDELGKINETIAKLAPKSELKIHLEGINMADRRQRAAS